MFPPANQPQPMPQPQPQPTQPPRKRGGALRIVVEIVGAIVILLIGIGIGAAAKSTSNNSASGSSSAPPAAAAATTTSAPPPAPVASPNGTYQGACNYTLGNDPAGTPSTAVATGDVQVQNTGNIGTVDVVEITWPQQGYGPLVMTKTIKLAAGASTDVQFHRPLTSNELDNLQNWQTGHNYSDGCTYKTTMTDTYGSPQ